MSGSLPCHSASFTARDPLVTGKVDKGSGASVLLVPQDERWRDGQFIGEAICNADGLFTIEYLRPGTYYAIAFDRIEDRQLKEQPSLCTAWCHRRFGWN